MTAPAKSNLLIYVTSALATAGIFIVELFTPLGMAIGLLYVPVLLLTLWLPYRVAPYAAAALYTVLIVLGYVHSTPGLAEEIALFNRTLSITVLWIVALLCDMWRNTSAAAQVFEERFHVLVEGVRDYALVMLDPSGNILTWNLGAERIIGYRMEEVLGRPASFFYPSEEVERGTPQRHLAMVAEAGRFEEEGWRLRKDGTRFLAHVVMTSLRDSRGGLRGFSVVTQDVTERRRVEQEREQLFEQVQAGRTRLQALSHQLIATQEAERRHIARELHDEIGQALSTLKILIQRSRQSAEASASAHLDEGVSIVNQTIDQVRTLSLDLRPSVLDDLGLIPALRWFVDNKARQAGIVGEFVADPMEPRLTPERELVCFRLVQEALTNVLRHARAKRMIVALSPRGSCLEVVIRDDGQGFDVASALTAAAGGKTIGLLGMQERVSLVGGELEIRSARGGGCEVRGRFPLADAENAI